MSDDRHVHFPEPCAENVESCKDTSSKREHSSAPVKCIKVILLGSNLVILVVSVLIIVFCIIRFVLPIEYDKSTPRDENFFILMVPSSLTCSSISAAGLLATFSGLSWPLLCYATVLIIPLVSAICWLIACAEEIATFKPEVMPMFALISLCCVTWFVQIVCSIMLSCLRRIKFTRNQKQQQLDEAHCEQLVVVD